MADQEPEILRSEVKAAIKKLKTGRSAGADEIVAEMIGAGGAHMVDLLHVLGNKIWKFGRWPDDWVTSIFIPIHKKRPNDTLL